MAKPLAIGTLIKKRDKSSPRWVPSGIFEGKRTSIPKKPY